MKALPIKLGQIVENIKNRTQAMVREGEGWCDDVYTIEVTAEELDNLYALALRFSDIAPTNEELDKA